MSSSKGISQARIGHEVPIVVAINNSLIVMNCRVRSAILAGSHQEDRPCPQRLRLFGSVCALSRQLRHDLFGSEHPSHF
jgi:hypothetical protein